jgi:hypothetical protein
MATRKGRGYKLSKRELVGWLVVGLLILIVPLIDRLLEKVT